MRILFSSFNVTTKQYLDYLTINHKIFGLIDKNDPNNTPQIFNVVEAKYLSYWLSYLFHYLKIDTVNPEFIFNIKFLYLSVRPEKVVIFDFYHFIFFQFKNMKKKVHNSDLYIWSETRRWPAFWINRLIMKSFWWYFKRNLSYVEKVFVFSDEGKKFFHANAPEVAVIVLPAPINTKLFFADTGHQYVTNNTVSIIMNARFIPLKEHRTFFNALRILKQAEVKFEVSLIGKGGHLQNELMELAEQLGIAQFITWLEPVLMEQLQKIYSKHDVLVLPSNREAIGMVVPEAMACGLATVTSEAVGANTYVEEGKTGLIFETENAEALADALEQLSKKGVAESYGKAAAVIIREQYSIDVLGKKLLEALE